MDLIKRLLNWECDIGSELKLCMPLLLLMLAADQLLLLLLIMRSDKAVENVLRFINRNWPCDKTNYYLLA